MWARLVKTRQFTLDNVMPPVGNGGRDHLSFHSRGEVSFVDKNDNKPAKVFTYIYHSSLSNNSQRRKVKLREISLHEVQDRILQWLWPQSGIYTSVSYPLNQHDVRWRKKASTLKVMQYGLALPHLTLNFYKRSGNLIFFK